MTASAPLPSLQAIVLADRVLKEPATGKFSLVGLFSALYATRFPSVRNEPAFVYVRFGDCHRAFSVRIRYRDLQAQKLLIESAEHRVSPPDDPLIATELITILPPFPMPHAGRYALEVYSDENLVGDFVLLVKQLPPGDPRAPTFPQAGTAPPAGPIGAQTPQNAEPQADDAFDAGVDPPDAGPDGDDVQPDSDDDRSAS